MKRTTNVDPRIRPAKPFHVLALDPGGTTGWSTAHWAPDYPNEQPPPPLFALDQIRFNQGMIGPDEHHVLLDEFLHATTQYFDRLPAGRPELEIVCESFEFRQFNSDHAHYKAKIELISKEYIGVIKLFCAQFDVPLTFQTASMAKTFIPDEKIKALGLWRPGMVHANDATRHVLRYLVVDKRIRKPIVTPWLEDKNEGVGKLNE